MTSSGQLNVLQADTHEVDSDIDSAVGASISSDTTSIASTIFHHREQWGRTYHKFRSGRNDYWGPNDELQNDTLDIGHYMLTLLLGGNLQLAPIHRENCHRVLDVGCGTGIWAIDFADAYPAARVDGVDLSPIQPTWVPPNCHFAVDDVEEEWTWPPDHFDFVHIRCLMGSISDWPALYRQAHRHLAPGGWIQHLDMSIQFTSDDGTVGPGHIMDEWSQTFIEAGERFGKTFRIANNSAQLIQDAGFGNLHQQWYKVPVGMWPKDKVMKEIGLANYYYCQEGCEGWALFLLTSVLRWEMEEIQAFIAKFRDALNDGKNHAHYKVGVVWGQKACDG